jgi:hypothetical protein
MMKMMVWQVLAGVESPKKGEWRCYTVATFSLELLRKEPANAACRLTSCDSFERESSESSLRYITFFVGSAQAYHSRSNCKSLCVEVRRFS